MPFKTFAVVGSPDYSDVERIRIECQTDNPAIGPFYLDRTVVDVGQWVKVESYVPDVLPLISAQNAEKWFLYFWDGSQWQLSFGYDGVNWVCGSSKMYALDGSIYKDIYGETEDYNSIYCATAMFGGERGQTKDRISTTMATQSITYSSYYGCKKRIGFAIKMPPDDGLDASDAGISQCRLKLEVYYANDGYTTTFVRGIISILKIVERTLKLKIVS